MTKVDDFQYSEQQKLLKRIYSTKSGSEPTRIEDIEYFSYE